MFLACAAPEGARAQDVIDPERGLLDESAPASAVDSEVPGEPESLDEDGAEEEGGAFLLAGKVGGGLPFNDLSISVAGAIEVGYLFRRADPSFGVFLDVSYFVPESEGSAVDARLASATPEGDGSYRWHVWQKQLMFQPTFVYRFAMLDEVFVPYAGIGPRLYLLETVVDGRAGDQRFPISDEVSTKVGFGVPLGCEFTLGPGGIVAELLFQWGPLKHEITGDTHLASTTLWVGYRALL